MGVTSFIEDYSRR